MLFIGCKIWHCIMQKRKTNANILQFVEMLNTANNVTRNKVEHDETYLCMNRT